MLGLKSKKKYIVFIVITFFLVKLCVQEEGEGQEILRVLNTPQ
jgi:hypothetical protein